MVASLYGWFYQDILRYLLSLTAHRQQAEDLTQETFLRAMARAHILQEMDKAACRAWLYKTARNLFTDQMRRQRREAELLQEAFEEAEPEPDQALWVADYLQRLSDEDGKLFRMRYLEAYKASELGQMYGPPAATVRTRLARARMKLRHLWLEDEQEEADKHEKA